MAKVNIVWYDGFSRVREEVELVSSTDETLTFKDSEGLEFTITRAQLIKITTK